MSIKHSSPFCIPGSPCHACLEAGRDGGPAPKPEPLKCPTCGSRVIVRGGPTTMYYEAVAPSAELSTLRTALAEEREKLRAFSQTPGIVRMQHDKIRALEAERDETARQCAELRGAAQAVVDWFYPDDPDGDHPINKLRAALQGVAASDNGKDGKNG